MAYAWLVDPQERTLKAYRLDGDFWLEIGRYRGSNKVGAPPFEVFYLDSDSIRMPAEPRVAARSARSPGGYSRRQSAGDGRRRRELQELAGYPDRARTKARKRHLRRSAEAFFK